MFQHVLSSNAGTIEEFFIPFYRSIGGVKISIGFYEIQCKYIKEHVDNVGLVILLAIFLRVSKRTKCWNKWLSLRSSKCYQNKEWANSCRNLGLNLEIPKTFLRSKCHKGWKANFKMQTARKFILGRLLINCKAMKRDQWIWCHQCSFQTDSGHTKHIHNL